jgi:hypothetical protein
MSDCGEQYVHVVDRSLREAVDMVGGELITIAHKAEKEHLGTAA